LYKFGGMLSFVVCGLPIFLPLVFAFCIPLRTLARIIDNSSYANAPLISELLGHVDVNVEYNIYVHLYGDGFDEMYAALASEK